MSAFVRWTCALCVVICLLLLLPSSQGKIHVHLVPHTHNDVGWLKTVDQYYTGANKVSCSNTAPPHCPSLSHPLIPLTSCPGRRRRTTRMRLCSTSWVL